MVQLIKVLGDYLQELFFYLKEGTQEMVGLSEDSKTFGYHDPTKAEIVRLNRDFSPDYEQSFILSHELGHGSRPKDSETMRRYGDSVGDYGFSGLEYEIAA